MGWWLWALLSIASAQSVDELQLAAPGQRSSLDVEVTVYSDGNIYFGNEVYFLSDLTVMLERMKEDEPELRAVIVADPAAAYETVMKVVEEARKAEVYVALEIQGAVAAKREDKIFEGVGVTEVLDDGLTKEQEMFLKPKHHRLPQNPYGTTDFTAYTLEWGETRIGLVSMEYGLAPHFQVGTMPVLDALGAFNLSTKVNISQGDRSAVALGANYANLPLAGAYEQSGIGSNLGLFGQSAGTALSTSSAYFFGVSAYFSYRIADPVTAHMRLNYVQAHAEGRFSLLQIPSLIAPGLVPDLGTGGPELVPAITGETGSFHLGLDYRLNRRDSVLLRVRGPFYAGVRVGIDLDELTGAGDSDGWGSFNLSGKYGDWVSPGSFYAASLGWQFQWRQWEARMGYGISQPGMVWMLQAFDVCYRFGGKTRRDERHLRRSFRRNMKDLDSVEDDGDDMLPFPPPP